MADLYALLEVTRDASLDDIKRAYRRKARELHPDTGGDEAGFKAVTHAYEILSDPDRRVRYDRFGDDGAASGGGGGDAFGFTVGDFGGIGDVINAFFGGGYAGGPARERKTAQQGRDVLAPIEIDLEVVATGERTPVSIRVAGICDVCQGSGSASGQRAARCQTCNGSGHVRRVSRTVFGQVATMGACPTCAGVGEVVADPCGTCAGEGRRSLPKTVTIAVPPGVASGDRLRVGGAGEAGLRGAAAGDLYVEIRVRPHDVFERDGRDLWCEVTVPMTQAALGSRLEVPPLTGDDLEVDLPAGTQHGDVLTVKRGGLPERGGGVAGHLYVRVLVEVPRHLDAEQTEILQRFASLRGDDVDGGGRGLFDRLRDAFR